MTTWPTGLQDPLAAPAPPWDTGAVPPGPQGGTQAFPLGLYLTWMSERGGVRFEVGGMTATQTVKMVGPGGSLVSLRGYETEDWHEGTAEGYGYHYEMPMGMPVGYVICEAKATRVSTETVVMLTTPSDEAWLRDLAVPTLSMKIIVVTTDDETRNARQAVLPVAGRGNAVVIFDVRESRQGSITILIINRADQIYGAKQRDLFEALINSGRPLLLSMDVKHGMPPCYLAVTDVTFTRYNKRPAWLVKINYVEVDNPIEVDLEATVEFTYRQGKDTPTAAAIYSQWRATYQTYGDLVFNRQVSEELPISTLDVVNKIINPRFMGAPLTTLPPAQAWTVARATIIADPAVVRHGDGPQSCKVTTTDTAGVSYLATTTTGLIPLDATAPFTLLGSIFPAVDGDYRLTAYFHDAAGALISSLSGTTVTCLANVWTDLRYTFTPPANTTQTRYAIGTAVAPAMGAIFWACEPMVIMGTYGGPYFDGQAADQGVYTYNWRGVADASVSERWVTTNP